MQGIGWVMQGIGWVMQGIATARWWYVLRDVGEYSGDEKEDGS